MKNRSIFVVALSLVAMLAAGPALGAPRGGNPEKIRIGYQPGHTLVQVAKGLGWLDEEFAKDGIKVEYAPFISGPPLIEAFAGERIDFGTTGDQPAIQARANSIPLKAIGIYSSGWRNYGLVVPPDSKIRSPRDLKGKKVAVTAGSVGHQLLYLYLKSAGLSVKDVQLVNLQPSDMKPALAARNIDALVSWEPFISTFERENLGVHVLDAKGYKTLYNVILASEKYARQYPDIVKRLLKVYVRTEKWIRDNPKKTIDVMAKETSFKPEVLAEVIPKSSYDIRLTKEAVGSISDTSRFLRENGVIRRDVDVRDLVDASYLKAIGLQ